MQRLDAWLDQRGWRKTNQRRSIAGLVFAIDSPFTADRLIAMGRALPDDRRVSTPTIYRTLEEFKDAGMVTSAKEDDETIYTRIPG